jgi:hypothetical protein
MKKTVKADALERARGSFLGPPVSVTRDDAKATVRLRPADLNALLAPKPVKKRYWIAVAAVAVAFLVGAAAGRPDLRVPSLPLPVKCTPLPVTLVAADLPPPAPERALERLTRAKVHRDIKRPLFPADRKAAP